MAAKTEISIQNKVVLKNVTADEYAQTAILITEPMFEKSRNVFKKGARLTRNFKTAANVGQKMTF